LNARLKGRLNRQTRNPKENIYPNQKLVFVEESSHYSWRYGMKFTMKKIIKFHEIFEIFIDIFRNWLLIAC